MIIVTMKHARSLDLCSDGIRGWFKRYDLDFSKFLSEGLPIEEVERIGDSIGLRVAAEARKEADGIRRR